MKAFLKNYRQSPRKVRLLADLVRGKQVVRADAILAATNKRASEPFRKLLASAVANAKAQGKDAEALVVKAVAVDEGTTMKRFMPRARGSASPIHRRSSHVSVELGDA